MDIGFLLRDAVPALRRNLDHSLFDLTQSDVPKTCW